jgi:type VI secretion system secreted protein Hcp
MNMPAAKFRRALIIGLVALTAASPARAALSYYVFISSIPGESTAQNHDDWIAALAFSGEMNNPPSIGPSGLTSTTPQFFPVTVLKPLDKASPSLAKAVAAGTSLGDVILDVIDSVSALPVYHITLRNAVASSYQVSGASELPMEFVSFDYEAIEWTYTLQGDPPFLAYWDRITVMGGPGPLPTPTPAMQQDSDTDGIPDSYEIANGLNPMFNDANGDKDGDGASNLSEYLAGTQANDPNSVFRVHGISRGDGTILITWSTVANRTYTIRQAAAPGGNGTRVQTGIPSFGGNISRTVPFTGAKLFFKVTTP